MLKKFLRPAVLTAALAASLFFLVLGAKWATFDRYGSAMPDWDQWDAEGLQLLAPWFEHDHFLSHLFQPHNEHRVVATKLQNLALTLLNGQWDSRLESTFNAALHSLLAVAFWLLAVRLLRPAPVSPSSPLPLSPSFTLPTLWLLTAAIFGLPLAWQNILGGFHSQQYWLLILSFAAMTTLPFARTWGAAWWAGLAAAALALLTMGSGFLAAAVVLAVVGFRAVRRDMTWRAAWPTLVFMAVLIAIGALTRVEVYYHQQLKAKTVHDFVFSLLRSLEWPLRDHDWAGAILWLPWVLAAVRVFRSRDPKESRAGQTIVALGGWVLVQLLATAYARGAGADYPASRYMDTPAFGLMANGLALAWLASLSFPLAPSRRLALTTLGLAWTVALGVGLWAIVDVNLRNDLPDAKKYYLKAESHVRGFLATDDPAQLAFPDIPYPSAGSLIERLAHPSLRALLPTIVRPPLPLVSAPAPSGVFLENRASQLLLDTAPRHGLSPVTPALASSPTWGSFNPLTGPAATGEWTSAPLTSPLGAWLKFETAGHVGEPGVSLELRDARTNALLANVRPTKIPGDTWRAAYLRAPREPFIVVARDTDPARWLAFSAPVEMGSLSHWAWRATKHGLLIAICAATVSALLAFAALFLCRAGSPDPAASPRQG